MNQFLNGNQKIYRVADRWNLLRMVKKISEPQNCVFFSENFSSVKTAVSIKPKFSEKTWFYGKISILLEAEGI